MEVLWLSISLVAELELLTMEAYEQRVVFRELEDYVIAVVTK